MPSTYRAYQVELDGNEAGQFVVPFRVVFEKCFDKKTSKEGQLYYKDLKDTNVEIVIPSADSVLVQIVGDKEKILETQKLIENKTSFKLRRQ